MDDGIRLPVLAVLGAADATADEERTAEEVGAVAARRGWVVLTGGGPGVMAAACRGAVAAGGLTVGILPSARPEAGYPNRWVRIPVLTGAGAARNAFNVLSATLCVAIGGGAGTLSEIALALKADVPVWCWRSWRLEPPEPHRRALPRAFEDRDALLEALDAELKRHPPADGA
ncbi:MAG TPA: DNA-processing protein DprA [Thermoanaerobaculales bacterium]|nr:DNA-processing protein DprA [Thermoanaerobaculales bacterium]HPA79954.1 DNA-processing protein DprA [Thermoanaerobaculales bacterium]HQL30932.1 DNA-processing protein DprA [Thermoanaerobaculales bacterium]HQP44132.1 DNA-processing protein DprA [Thermoanaerobaculales bacterium]